MDDRKQKRLKRKRKLETVNSEYNIPQNRNRVFDEKAKMEEEELSKDLFGDKSGFFKSLEDPADSGLCEIETEESSSNEELKPVWQDQEDEGIDIGFALRKQGQSFKARGDQSLKSKYSSLLESKFQSVVGRPKWAEIDVEKEKTDEALIQSCGGHIKKSKTKYDSIKSGLLEFKKVQDLNLETYNEGPKITTVEFNVKCSVALVAGVSGVASIYAVDGKRNDKLHSVAFKGYPIACGRFLNGGMEAILGSNHSHIFSYDLQAAKAVELTLSHGITKCKQFEVSPDESTIAICGRWGEIHLLTGRSKELITTLKQNDPVTSLAFNNTGTLLFTHSQIGEVSVWDMTTRRLRHKFQDEGCLHGTTLAVAPSGQLLAAGSKQGVVNLYSLDTILSTPTPKPLKSIMNLTTSINCLKFNSTSEILGFATREFTNSVRLFHVPSKTVFSNFPRFPSKLGRINTLQFSPNSGYAAFANMNSTVALFRLKHYNHY